jgi:hypothetical protein
MKRDAVAVTETTPEGLAALIYHIAHSASQGSSIPNSYASLASAWTKNSKRWKPLAR